MTDIIGSATNYIKETKSGFVQNDLARGFHDKAANARAEVSKFIVVISVSVVAFIYLEFGFSGPASNLEIVASLSTLLGFALAASCVVFAWHFDARRFYATAKAIEATDPAQRTQLRAGVKRLTTNQRRLIWTGRWSFLLSMLMLSGLATLKLLDGLDEAVPWYHALVGVI